MKATFEADFSNFNTEVDKSVAKMKSIEAEANHVNVQLNKMVDEFSGQKIIDQANAMGLAMTAVGGASRLTDEELKKVAKTTAEAADRFLAFGKDVPPTMQAVIREIQDAQRASAAFKAEVESWGPSLIKAKEAQAVLRQTGGGAATGGLATEVQNVLSGGGAGLQIAVWSQIAKEVWNTANALADWAEQERLIPDFTAKMLGYGDAVKEAAEAKADMFARASQLAQREITNEKDALQVLNTEYEKQKQHLKDLAEYQQKNIDREQKRIEQLDRESAALQRRMEQEANAAAARHKREEEEAARTLARVHELEQGLKTVHPGLFGFGREEQQFTQQQLAAGGKEAATNVAMRQAQMAAQGVLPEKTAFTEYAEDMKHLGEEVKRVAAATGDYVVAQERGRLLQEEATNKFTASMMAAAKANDDWINSLKPKTGMFESGEAITPWSTLAPKPITIKPIGPYPAGGAAAAAAGAGINTTVQVSGVLDPRTIRELADAVSQEIMRSLGRQLPNA